MRGNLTARYSPQGKESIWGGGAVLCPGSFHQAGKGVQKEGTAFKQTESSLPVLVFCAIKKPEKNKYNLKTSYMTLKASLGTSS